MKQLPLTAALSALVALHLAGADPVDDYLEGEMTQRQIPGLALAVVRSGQTIKVRGYGLANLELKAPVRPDTVFEIGSLTKQFTAAGILLLQQAGRLAVDDPVGRHLPTAPESWRRITLRHLLTHTSGLKNYTGLNGFEWRRHLTQTQFIQAIAALPIDFQPGESWKYCNTGYNVLGFVIENVSGRNYWDFMAERIFRPLGMNDTGQRAPAPLLPRRAQGYQRLHGAMVHRDEDLTDVFAAGAMTSTVPDLIQWNRALDGGSLLKPATKAQMWTPAQLNNDRPTHYGFGWSIDTMAGHHNIGHSGSTAGFSATLQRFPDDLLTVIVLTNTEEQVAPGLARHVASLYLR